jgi:hypothetical protein
LRYQQHAENLLAKRLSSSPRYLETWRRKILLPTTVLVISALPSNWTSHRMRLALTVCPGARVFKLALGALSVLETTLSPSTRLEIDATDVAAAATVVVGGPCMQEVQGDS